MTDNTTEELKEIFQKISKKVVKLRKVRTSS